MPTPIANRAIYKARLVFSAVTGSKRLLPTMPRHLVVNVNLTENCQARCRTCDYWHKAKDNPISTARAKRLVEEIADHGFQYLRWIGGEPLLRRDLFEVLAHVPEDTFAKVVLGTNGGLLQRFVTEINESCLTNITVSLDGFGAANQELRGIDFDQVRDALTHIVGKRIKIASIFTRHLAEDIDRFLDWCSEEGYDYDIVLPSGVLPYSCSEEINRNIAELWPDAEQVDRVLGSLLDRKMVTGSMAAGAQAYMIRRQEPFSRCMLGYTQIRITANGDVYVPCFQMGSVGNILKQPLNEAIDANRSGILATRMFDLDCNKCVMGWQTSRVFERPWGNVPYVFKRLRTRPQKTMM